MQVNFWPIGLIFIDIETGSIPRTSLTSNIPPMPEEPWPSAMKSQITKRNVTNHNIKQIDCWTIDIENISHGLMVRQLDAVREDLGSIPALSKCFSKPRVKEKADNLAI